MIVKVKCINDSASRLRIGKIYKAERLTYGHAEKITVGYMIDGVVYDPSRFEEVE